MLHNNWSYTPGRSKWWKLCFRLIWCCWWSEGRTKKTHTAIYFRNKTATSKSKSKRNQTQKIHQERRLWRWSLDDQSPKKTIALKQNETSLLRIFEVKAKSNPDKKSNTVRQVQTIVQRIKIEWYQAILLLIYKFPI